MSELFQKPPPNPIDKYGYYSDLATRTASHTAPPQPVPTSPFRWKHPGHTLAGVAGQTSFKSCPPPACTAASENSSFSVHSRVFGCENCHCWLEAPVQPKPAHGRSMRRCRPVTCSLLTPAGCCLSLQTVSAADSQPADL